MEAGSRGLTLSCIVHVTVNGLTNIPSGHWMGPSGPVSAREGIIMVDTRNNIWSINVTFSSLHTSHAEEYTCQWSLFTPAEGGKNVTTTSIPLTVAVRCKWCGRSLILCVQLCGCRTNSILYISGVGRKCLMVGHFRANFVWARKVCP